MTASCKPTTSSCGSNSAKHQATLNSAAKTMAEAKRTVANAYCQPKPQPRPKPGCNPGHGSHGSHGNRGHCGTGGSRNNGWQGKNGSNGCGNTNGVGGNWQNDLSSLISKISDMLQSYGRGNGCGCSTGGGYGIGGAGSDTIDGGAGDDVAVYDKNKDCYQIYTKDGKGTIQLGDRYTISLNEANSTWELTDKCDGGKTTVWGDPHVNTNGDGANWDFKKDGTFQLDDGTKITVGTTPFGNSGQTLSSTLTITNGDNAIKVSGLGMNYDGANNLKVDQSYNGKQLDAQTSDGALSAKESGKGWTIDGKPTDQKIVNEKEAAAAK